MGLPRRLFIKAYSRFSKLNFESSRKQNQTSNLKLVILKFSLVTFLLNFSRYLNFYRYVKLRPTSLRKASYDVVVMRLSISAITITSLWAKSPGHDSKVAKTLLTLINYSCAQSPIGCSDSDHVFSSGILLAAQANAGDFRQDQGMRDLDLQ